MSKGVTAALEVVGAAVAAYFGAYQLAAALLGAAYQTERAARAEITARNAYNASLRDRYAMVRGATTARQLVFGRCRVSGPTFFVSSWGTDLQQLTFLVALAAHEVDAIETVYFDDKPISIGTGGNVVGILQTDSFSIATTTATVTLTNPPSAGTITATARYGDTIVPLTITSTSGVSVSISGGTSGLTGKLDITYLLKTDPFGPVTTTQHRETFAIVTGSDTFTLANTPDAAGVHVVYQSTSGTSDDAAPISASLTGGAVTISGGTVGRTAVVYYQNATGVTKARVRKYTGSPLQLADSTLQSEFPGVWTTAHKAHGVAYLIVELTYDQNAFIGGVPNVSAVVRGMKCFDPRTGTTAWTENLALHARALATHPMAGNLPAASIDDVAVSVAANICDTSTAYTVGGAHHARALYTGAYSFAVDRKPMDGLTDLCQAMGGGWVFVDGQLRINAGSYRTPNPGVLDETWLTDGGDVQIQVGYARSALVNTITGSFSDQYQNYQVVPFPRLSPSAYTDTDGAILSQDIQYAAIPFSGQAQYVASCLLRRQRQGMVVKLHCNFRAWQDEIYDVRLVSIARFGWSNKPFEVISTAWTVDGAIELTLQETDPSIWNMDAGFSASDVAPNTNFPTPWGLLPPTGITVTSDDTTLLRQADGTVLPRISVSWTAITDSRVLLGGYVEVRYWRLGDSSDTYQSVRTPGASTQVFLPDTRAGSQYLVALRTVSVVAQSPWSDQSGATVFGKTIAPSNVTGATVSLVNNAQHFSWNACTDVDYKLTELRSGASWAAGTVIASLSGKSFDWQSPPTGSFTVWIAHLNRSGIYSATPVSLSGQAFKPIPNLFVRSSTTPHTAACFSGVRFNSTGYVGYRSGGSSSTFADDTSVVWGDATPPASNYKIRFDLFSSIHVASGAGTPSLSTSSATFSALNDLNSTTYEDVVLSGTNVVADVTIAWTLFNAAGTAQLATGLIKLYIESTD